MARARDATYEAMGRRTAGHGGHENGEGAGPLLADEVLEQGIENALGLLGGGIQD